MRVVLVYITNDPSVVCPFPGRFVRFGHESKQFALATVSDRTNVVEVVMGFAEVAACIHDKIERYFTLSLPCTHLSTETRSTLVLSRCMPTGLFWLVSSALGGLFVCFIGSQSHATATRHA